MLFFILGIAVCILQAKQYSAPMLSLMDAVGLNISFGMPDRLPLGFVNTLKII
ncbi:MAG: hypothetical protein IJQ88_07670 [Clostridia bacterium]|nr:hypothetical protein [Clostridia bacterium]MBQ6383571.1 hypothetical protein [Clostridia bacterium]MBQ6722026.1 hypothetical protein [Clostridia bacterium]